MSSAIFMQMNNETLHFSLDAGKIIINLQQFGPVLFYINHFVCICFCLNIGDVSCDSFEITISSSYLFSSSVSIPETVEVNAGQHRNVAIVTKLVDSEQIEMEGSEHFGAGGVVLETEAKSARISLHLFFWKAALKYCLDDGDSFISCSTVPFLCRYAQVLVGYPVPMCFATSAQHQSLVYGQLFHSTEDRVVSKLKAKHEATVIVGKKMTPLPEANDASSKTAFDAELASFHSLNSLVSSPAESENTMMNSELISGSKLTLDQISEGNGDLNNSHNPFPTPVNTTSCYQSETPVDRHTAFSGQSSLPLSENTVTVQSVHTQLTHGRLQQDVDTVAMKETVDSNEFLKNASDYVDDNLVHLDGSQPLGHVISSLSSETLIDSKMTSSRTLQTPAHFTAHNDLNSSDASISDLQSAAQAIKVSPTPVEDDSMNTVTLQFGSVSTTPFPAVLHDVFESNPHGIPPVSQVSSLTSTSYAMAVYSVLLICCHSVFDVCRYICVYVCIIICLRCPCLWLRTIAGKSTCGGSVAFT